MTAPESVGGQGTTTVAFPAALLEQFVSGPAAATLRFRDTDEDGDLEVVPGATGPAFLPIRVQIATGRTRTEIVTIVMDR